MKKHEVNIFSIMGKRLGHETFATAEEAYNRFLELERELPNNYPVGYSVYLERLNDGYLMHNTTLEGRA